MNLRNKVQLIGNCGRDPEIISFGNGNKKASFTLATSETYKNRNGEKVTDTEWHNVVIIGKLAEVVERYVKKGTMLVLEGKIKTRSYDAKNGDKRYITEIICHSLEMLGSKPNNGKQEVESTIDNSDDGEIDDLPF